MTAPNRRLAAAIATAAVAAGVLAAAGDATPPDAATRADALAAAPATVSGGPVHSARTVRVAASVRAAAVPLPAGGTFDGVRWELGGDAVEQSAMDGVLQYNAACQWLRAWRDGREREVAARVLRAAPAWPALRGTESGDWLASVAKEVGAGGGETVAAMLVDCDASHVRETEYAAGLGLKPSR